MKNYVTFENLKLNNREQQIKAECVRDLWNSFSKYGIQVKVKYLAFNENNIEELSYIKVTNVQNNYEYEYSINMDSVAYTLKDTIDAIDTCFNKWVA